jgi:hypothetical protein
MAQGAWDTGTWDAALWDSLPVTGNSATGSPGNVVARPFHFTTGARYPACRQRVRLAARTRPQRFRLLAPQQPAPQALLAWSSRFRCLAMTQPDQSERLRRAHRRPLSSLTTRTTAGDLKSSSNASASSEKRKGRQSSMLLSALSKAGQRSQRKSQRLISLRQSKVRQLINYDALFADLDRVQRIWDTHLELDDEDVLTFCYEKKYIQINGELVEKTITTQIRWRQSSCPTFSLISRWRRQHDHQPQPSPRASAAAQLHRDRQRKMETKPRR